ncbi:MAG: efflux RND transporter periplasmic adaptor subunit [Gammaproteobacteria bacterium]|nr:efflux RND transporter periplasmic adaptor subunit [Gammaproteobacteria bacterium]
MNRSPSFKKTLRTITTGAVLISLGAAGGWWWAKQAAGPESVTVGNEAAVTSTSANKVLYWYDPMYPQQHFDKPGKSPFMDMALVPKYASEKGEPTGVKIDPAMAQNLGMRLATVARVPLASQVDATGIIGYNERDVAVVQSRAEGFVERVWPLAPGDVIEAGQPLAEVLVPAWAAAQHEFLAAKSSGNGTLLAIARERLHLVGMSDEQIHTIEHDGTPRSIFRIDAPIDGVIQSLDVRTGMTLTTGQTLARINGLATVWLDVAVPEARAGDVQIGSNAVIYLTSIPGQALNGRVTTILPVLNDGSRSLRIRIELFNPDGHLRPGLSAQVSLDTSSDDTALAVPTEAVIRTGKRSLVMVADDQGRFMPAEVTLGREIGGQTMIASGLSEGQRVVSSGQFLLDSEASLNGIIANTGEVFESSLPAALHEADATITGISTDEVTLAHGPFKTLSMPGMTMTFPLARPGLAHDLKTGDKVRVGVRQTDNGLVVERIEKMGDGR